MLRHLKLFSDLADGAERVRTLVHAPPRSSPRGSV
jgi:hypothetical protein